MDVLSGWIPQLHINYVFQWRAVWASLPHLLEGTLVTLEITVLSMMLGIAFAIALAMGRMRGSGLLYYVSSAWVEIARNTPALFQVYMAFFGLGAFGIYLSPYTAVLAAVMFNNAGYLAETLRGGFKAVPETQMSAARSLGMSALQANRRVIIPQVLRVVFLPMINQMVWAMLTTSLGMVVGLKELAGVTQLEQSRTFRTFEFFLAAAAIYFLMAKAIIYGARLIAWRFMSRGA